MKKIIAFVTALAILAPASAIAAPAMPTPMSTIGDSQSSGAIIDIQYHGNDRYRGHGRYNGYDRPRHGYNRPMPPRYGRYGQPPRHHYRPPPPPPGHYRPRPPRYHYYGPPPRPSHNPYWR